jgi:hypothetical protein
MCVHTHMVWGALKPPRRWRHCRACTCMPALSQHAVATRTVLTACFIVRVWHNASKDSTREDSTEPAQCACGRVCTPRAPWHRLAAHVLVSPKSRLRSAGVGGKQRNPPTRQNVARAETAVKVRPMPQHRSSACPAAAATKLRGTRYSTPRAGNGAEGGSSSTAQGGGGGTKLERGGRSHGWASVHSDCCLSPSGAVGGSPAHTAEHMHTLPSKVQPAASVPVLCSSNVTHLVGPAFNTRLSLNFGTY